jgi:predicted metal-dependent peptidase
MTTEEQHRSDPIALKLSAARTQLVIEKPFLGTLVLRLPLVAADPDWCRTTATDARAFYYNPHYIERLSLEQTKFMLAHEALHGALSHFHRRQHRAKRRWDIACDIAINELLVADGLIPPEGALLQDRYRGMPAEEIYPYIKEHPDEATLDDHLYDEPDTGEGSSNNSGSGATPADPPPPKTADSAPDTAMPPTARGAPRPAPLSAKEREEQASQWQLRMAGAAQEAMRAGKLSESMARALGNLLVPQVPWRSLLARYVSTAARTDYSFSRPNRREGAAILPGLRAAQIDLVVVIDTSGSVRPEEMDEFISEVNTIKSVLNARIVLHACDAALAADGPWTYEPWDELRLPSTLAGGGGTRFTPAFEWAAQLDRQPDLLLYFTDADGEFPEREPSFPVLWLVKGAAPVPWGQRIQLN